MEVISNIPSATYDYYQNNIKPKPEEVGKSRGWSDNMALQNLWIRICGRRTAG